MWIKVNLLFFFEALFGEVAGWDYQAQIPVGASHKGVYTAGMECK